MTEGPAGPHCTPLLHDVAPEKGVWVEEGGEEGLDAARGGAAAGGVVAAADHGVEAVEVAWVAAGAVPVCTHGGGVCMHGGGVCTKGVGWYRGNVF